MNTTETRGYAYLDKVTVGEAVWREQGSPEPLTAKVCRAEFSRKFGRIQMK